MSKKATFEQAMKDLEEIVRELEAGELPLDESLKKFEEGMKLSKLCSLKLEEAEKRVSILLKERDGELTKAPYPPGEEESR
jgi:exodeoxyribonuclease VII small subunit